MGLRRYIKVIKWQTTILRDPYNPVRDFRERMVALFSDDDEQVKKTERK
ncbi:MAG: hypothetical protein J5542_05790 [Bacteroidales bacterium]|nr:hypothetical protein [Bacteroidales bacterium]